MNALRLAFLYFVFSNVSCAILPSRGENHSFFVCQNEHTKLYKYLAENSYTVGDVYEVIDRRFAVSHPNLHLPRLIRTGGSRPFADDFKINASDHPDIKFLLEEGAKVEITGYYWMSAQFLNIFGATAVVLDDNGNKTDKYFIINHKRVYDPELGVEIVVPDVRILLKIEE